MRQIVVIVGYGSVGKKFYEILKLNKNLDCWVLSTQENIGLENHIKNYSDIALDSLVVISVPDKYIEEVSKKINKDIWTVHTSGATPMDVLVQKVRGVFYPLQSFASELENSNIPMLLEANQDDLLSQLRNLASYSNTIVDVKSKQRLLYHMSAVIMNNFTNFLFVLGKDFADNNELNFDLLKPIIRETVARIETQSPTETQTGPAMRDDSPTIEAHKNQLSNNADLKKVYDLFTELIQKKF